MPVLRSVLAVIAGLIVASVLMMGVEFVNGHHIYPELGHAAEGLTDPEQIRAVLATAPTGAFLVVIIGWILGSFAGGFVAAKIAKALRVAIITGVLLTLLGILNNLMLPPPSWFWISVIVFLPAAWLGGRTAVGRTA